MNPSAHNLQLSGNDLKMIACISMLLDHIVKVFNLQGIPALLLSNILGRLAFPLFGFLLVEGFFHTHSRICYFRNLLLLALISEMPYRFAMGYPLLGRSDLNILFELTLGILMLICIDRLRQSKFLHSKKPLQIACQVAVLSAFCAAAWLVKADYSYSGLFMIAVFYYSKIIPSAWQARPESRTFLACAALNINVEFFGNPCAFLTILPTYFYNGKRGRQIKLLFYLFYPFHLLVLRLILLCIG